MCETLDFSHFDWEMKTIEQEEQQGGVVGVAFFLFISAYIDYFIESNDS